METPQISRSGRVLKKSAKVKEMEDFDINELDVQGKPRKKSKGMDDFDEFDDKRVAPIKIPKISLNMQGGPKKRLSDGSSPVSRQLFKNAFQGTMKVKTEARHNIYQDSSDGSKESDSSSVSSDTSSSATSSDASEGEDPFPPDSRYDRKNLSSGLQALSVHHDKVIVETQQYEPPTQYMEQSSDVSSEDSEDAASDPALVIAEDSDDAAYPPKGKKAPAAKRGMPVKKEPSFASKPVGRKKPAPKTTDAGRKKKSPTGNPKPLTAYMLWCAENRKKIAATSGNIGFGNIGKKMGEAWQALPEKDKLAWRRKAKRLALQSASNSIINVGPAVSLPTKAASRAVPNLSEEILKGLTESTGTLGSAPIDVAAHLKLLGDSLTVIGQRLIEHEGQLAVSGIYSVLLDTLLCAIGPLLCLTSEITGLESVPPETFQKTLDHIAYFMPGL